MCAFCAAIPVAVATGAKLNADQRQSPSGRRRPFGLITGIVVALLAIGSVIYHGLVFRS
jgi:Na+/melibiose symporter-like transporter